MKQLLSPISADLVAAFHLLYVLFAVGGEISIIVGALFNRSFIRNLVFRIVHLVSVLIVTLESIIGVFCPITELEYYLRGLAGQRIEEDITFVGRLVGLIIYYDFPNWVFTVVYICFGVIVLLTFVLITPARSAKSKKGRDETTS